MRILKDANGNIFKANVVSTVPEGFEDITDTMQTPNELANEENKYLEAVEVSKVDYVAPVAEELDIDGNVIVAEVIEVLAVERHFTIQKKTNADIDRRNAILDKLRELRAPLLVDADIEVNKIEDVNGDTTAIRTYRQALRDIPSTYIKVDGDPKVATDTIDLENFTWPVKP